MKKGKFTLVENTALIPGMHRLTFSGDGSGIVPGQFAEVAVPGYFLRRPFSVAGFDGGSLTLAVRVRGEGMRACAPRRCPFPAPCSRWREGARAEFFPRARR